MNGYTFLLLSILRLFLLIAALVLLAKAKLLPLYLYLTIAEFIGPALKVDHRLVYYGIAAFLLLLPAAYWISCCAISWRRWPEISSKPPPSRGRALTGSLMPLALMESYSSL